MIVEFNLSNLIFLAIALAGGLWALIKLLFAAWEKALDRRFDALGEMMEKDQQVTHQLEREFLKFQSEIPRTYVRRDDYMREAQALQEALQREIAPIRISVNRIEDFLIQK